MIHTEFFVFLHGGKYEGAAVRDTHADVHVDERACAWRSPHDGASETPKARSSKAKSLDHKRLPEALLL